MTGAESPDATDVYDEILDRACAAAEAELQACAARLRTGGLSVRPILYEGDPEEALLDVEQTELPDLVVMSTHGWSGFSRFALGSVTERVVREGISPVLIVRPPLKVPPELRTALVPLDGSGVAEEVLPLVKTLALQPIQMVKLFRVVADPDDRTAARNYLEGVAAHLTPTGVQCELQVDVGEPRQAIKAAATDVDLVMLSTHGHGGFDRWRHGSVAAFVAREVNRPVLLVRAHASVEAVDPGGPVRVGAASSGT
jgi:nucleotide-binding universal stress UspA family protein